MNITIHAITESSHKSFSSVQSLSCVRIFATPWTAVCQASLSISNSRSLLKLTSIESVLHPHFMLLSHLTINTASQTTATVLISQTLQFRNMAYLPRFTILEWSKAEIQREVSLALRPALGISVLALGPEGKGEQTHSNSMCACRLWRD